MDKKRLKQLVRLAEIKELQAQQKRMMEKNQLEKQQQLLYQLETYHKDYQKKGKEETENSISAAHFQRYHGFVLHLEKLQQDQSQQIQSAKRKEEKAHEDWMKTMIRKKQMESIQEKHEKLYQSEQEKKEQAVLDEWVSQAWLKEK